MLDIIQLDISSKLTPQVTTIISHYIKKILLKKIQKYGGNKSKNSYVNKNDTLSKLYIFIKNSKNRLNGSLLYLK